MSRALLAAATILIAYGLGNASAADFPVKAAPAPVAPTWTGFYLGVNGGWGWSDIKGSFAVAGGFTPGFSTLPVLSTKNDGAVFGGQLGYNYQVGNWVFGVEGDIDGASIDGTEQAVFPINPALALPFTHGLQVNERVNWLATARGRLGYTWGPGLIYVTGGGAWENVTLNALASAGFGGLSTAGDFSSTKSGWTIGGGYEWMFVPNWMLRAEYLHYGFSGSNATLGFLPTPTTLSVTTNKQNVDVVRVGLSYKFGQTADLALRATPAPVAPTWTGLYLGVNGGWGWSDFKGSFAPTGPIAGPLPVGGFGPLPALSTKNDGAVFGGQLGYNYQVANWVFGVEGDIDGATISGTQQAVFNSLVAGFTDGIQVNERINWLATARGRLGYAWGPGLIYVTGGGAWENATLNALASEGSFGLSAASNSSTTKSGWTIGGGYEWMFVPNWMLRAEYLHYGFSGSNATLGFGPVSGNSTLNVTTNKQNVDVVRLGLSYKLDWWRLAGHY